MKISYFKDTDQDLLASVATGKPVWLHQLI
jgi:hypothetical protein